MSRGFRTILCAVDFSASSRVALQHAAVIGRRFKSRLVVLFVNDPLLATAAAVAYDERALAAETMKELRQFVERAVGRPGAPAATCLVSLGNPAREIQKAARRLGSDLVVVGTRGLTGLGKLFLGSTTNQLLRRATVPVLAVPFAGVGRGKSVPSSWPRRIVAAVELNRRARTSVALASQVARLFGARLMVITVVPAVSAPSWLRINPSDRVRMTETHERLRTLTSKVPKGLDAGFRVLVGNAAEQIAAASADTGASLTVMTLKRRGGLLGPRPGSTTYQVLCRTARPVLALPERARIGRT